MTALDFNQQLLSMSDRLFHFALGLTRNGDDAKDLIQESMLKALTNREKYQEGSNFKAWMHTIVRNTFINEHRRNERGRSVMSDLVRQDRAVLNGLYLDGPLSALQAKEMEDRLERLPQAQREAFRMSVNGFRYEEIAERLNVPVGTVKSRIFQARRTLMDQLGPETSAA
ncbi:MAG: sigma-70 family RNA polymerase sigma factor [Flavobacteriales bacterium]|nr:sigma-70 family RNA polymerase sigma factor [Flavobacteriales bacterium]